MSPPGPPACLTCKHFKHAPAELEAALPGLSSLSSAYAAVRADDGICASSPALCDLDQRLPGALRSRSVKFDP